MSRAEYMTPDGFAELALEIAEQQGYFKRDQEMHPDDIHTNLDTIMATIAATAHAIMSKANLMRAIDHMQSQ